jgi:hypothetical protein
MGVGLEGGTVVSPPVGAGVGAAEVAGAPAVGELAEDAEPVGLGVDAASSPEQAAARATRGSARATSHGR